METPSESQSDHEISSHPEKVKTHFLMLTPVNKKGQARYRCRQCGHEFQCSGRVRMIHHIVGVLPDGTLANHVKACSNPFLPLKTALFKRLKKDMKRKREYEEMLSKKRKQIEETTSVAKVSSSVLSPLPSSRVDFDRSFYEKLSPERLDCILHFANQLDPRAVAAAMMLEQNMRMVNDLISVLKSTSSNTASSIASSLSSPSLSDSEKSESRGFSLNQWTRYSLD